MRALCVRFRRRGSDLAVVFGRGERGGGGVFIEGASLGEGLGLGRHRTSDGSGRGRVQAGLVEDDDSQVGPTCQRPKRCGGVPFRVRWASWAWAVSWHGPVGLPAALFYFF
jgi:hypothetical protein